MLSASEGRRSTLKHCEFQQVLNFLETQQKLTTHSVEVHIILSQSHASVFKLGKQKHRNLVDLTKTVYMHTMTDVQVDPSTYSG